MESHQSVPDVEFQVEKPPLTKGEATLKEIEETESRIDSSLEKLKLYHDSLGSKQNFFKVKEILEKEELYTARVKFQNKEFDRKQSTSISEVYLVLLPDVGCQAHLSLRRPDSLNLPIAMNETYIADLVRVKVSRKSALLISSCSKTVLRLESQKPLSISELEFEVEEDA